MKLLFYLLTAAAHPFGLYVVVPLYMGIMLKTTVCKSCLLTIGY